MQLKLISSLSIIALLWTLTACHQKPKVLTGTDDVASAMVDLSRAKRYDKAIQIGEDWLRKHESDSTIYQQVGIVYLLKARTDPSRRDESLTRVVDCFNKSLAAAPKDAFVVHQAARGFEIVAEFSRTDQRCGYYQKSKAALDQEAAILVAQGLLLNGQSFSMTPPREAHYKFVVYLAEKMRQANCT